MQYKIQRRQLRVQHPDDHFCAAQLKYLNEKAVEMRGNVAFLCYEDKAKVPVCEPNAPVPTGIGGKMATDGAFLDDLQELFEKHATLTSALFVPYFCQFKETCR